MTGMRPREHCLLDSLLREEVDPSGVDVLDALGVLVDTQDLLERLLWEWVEQARRGGRTWGQIALSLGVSEQAARQHYDLCDAH